MIFNNVSLATHLSFNSRYNIITDLAANCMIGIRKTPEPANKKLNILPNGCNKYILPFHQRQDTYMFGKNKAFPATLYAEHKF